MAFGEWFEEYLTVGAYPIMNTGNKVDFNEFDMTVNVSDEFYPDIDNKLRNEFGCLTHWFPMNEAGHDNGVNSIYGACYVLRLAENAGMRVYLHCHAGVHRSQVVKAAYYFSRTNHHLTGHEYNGWPTALHHDCECGLLPPLREMESFLGTASKAVHRIQHKFVGGSLDDAKISHIKVYKLQSLKSPRKNTTPFEF